MIKFFRSVPLALSGLSLAFAALGNLLRPYGEEFRYACGIISAIILIIFVLKIVLDFPHAREEWKTSVSLSTLSTSTMALMLLCTYIKPIIGIGAIFLWYISVIAHVFIMLLFIKRFVIRLNFNNVYPSWFIAFVGIVTVSVTAPDMGLHSVGQYAFYTGFLLYFVALAFILIKVKKRIYVSEPIYMTSAIFAAPMSLCIVGYFSSFEQQNEILVYFMLGTAIISYIFVSYIMIAKLLQAKFYPTYSAFTFPYVISAIAFRIGTVFLAERGIYFFAPFAYITKWIAIAVVLYVLVRYIMFFRWIRKF